jgi:hypothetical protein
MKTKSTFHFSNAVQAFYFAALVDSDDYDLLDPQVAVFTNGGTDMDLVIHISNAIKENVQ